jgi:hypothetical protein
MYRVSYALCLPFLRLTHVQAPPFWNADVAATSALLWQATDDNLVAHQRALPGIRAHGERSMWCSVKTYDALTPINDEFSCDPKKCVEPPAKKFKKKRKKDEPQVEQEELLVRKIRLAPSAAQKAVLRQWVGAARRVYNNVIEHVKKDHKAANQKTLRPLFVHNAAYSTENNSWMLQVPYDVRDGALQDALAAIKNARNLKHEKGIASSLKFRSKKKSLSESIYLCKRNVERRGDNEVEFYKRFNLGKMRAKEDLPKSFDHDLRLQRNALDEFYLLVPTTAPARPIPPPPKIKPRSE